MNKIMSLAVFCGSRAGNNPLYEIHAGEIGALLAEKRINIVCGGGNKGLMGALANAALEKNGTVTGIMPKILSDYELQHTGLTELHLTDDMHSRKNMMYARCDAAIALAGGYGTLDELFEMITWHTLNLHHKKVFLLNSGGFYSHLIAHIAMMQKEGLLYRDPKDQLTVIDEPQELGQYL